jgi:hypothetical protein
MAGDGWRAAAHCACNARQMDVKVLMMRLRVPPALQTSDLRLRHGAATPSWRIDGCAEPCIVDGLGRTRPRDNAMLCLCRNQL